MHDVFHARCRQKVDAIRIQRSRVGLESGQNHYSGLLIPNLCFDKLENDVLGGLEPDGDEAWGWRSPEKVHLRIRVTEAPKHNLVCVKKSEIEGKLTH